MVERRCGPIPSPWCRYERSVYFTAMVRTAVSALILASSVACAAQGAAPTAPAGAASVQAQPPSSPPVPPVVDGWREYPLRDGVISIRPTRWRTDNVDVPVPPGKGLEYKLTMKKGETVVYNISFVNLADPAKMVSEFHGHTKQVDGVGDLMFYSKTGGSPQSGAFTAPWDGIHGWYLKNDSAVSVTAKLELAGFYEPGAK